MNGVKCNPRLGAKRVGLIIPSVNATIEPELAWVAPPGLSFHAARIMLRETTPEGLRAMNAELDGAARLVASVAPDVVAYACTSGSFLDGPKVLREQIDALARIVNCPVVATSAAMIEAVRAMKARCIALATPYLDAINEAEKCFFEANGVRVISMRGLGLSGPAIREVPPEGVIEVARAANHVGADAVFISCTDFRALETVDFLEAEFGKPVLTSNQVTLWATLRELGLATTIRGFGTLLS